MLWWRVADEAGWRLQGLDIQAFFFLAVAFFLFISLTFSFLFLGRVPR